MKRLINRVFLLFLTVVGLAACSSEDAETTGKVQQSPANMTEFSVGDAPTRTAGEYVNGSGTDPNHVKFYWTGDDHIWVNKSTTGGTDLVKNDRSDLTAADKVERTKFFFNENLSANTYNVRYTGSKSTKADEVVFAKEQIQDAPNDARKIGEYGDCGVAVATKMADRKYTFNLTHKASYLVLNPYSSVHQFSTDVGVVAVFVQADQLINGTFKFDDNGLKYNAPDRPVSTVTNDKRKTTIWYYKQRFERNQLVNRTPSESLPIPASADVTKNGIIIVLPPGEYTNVKIDYALVDQATNGCGYYRKIYKKLKLEEGKTCHLEHDIKLADFSKDDYYTWDAPVGEYFWKGHEDKQLLLPVKDPVTQTEGFPDADSDARWYNATPGASTNVYQNVATRSAKDAMTANGAMWLAWQGTPTIDMGKMYVIHHHLYNGGVWFDTLEALKQKTGRPASHFTDIGPTKAYGGAMIDYRKKTETTDLATVPLNRSYADNERTPGINSNTKRMFLPARGYYDFLYRSGTTQLETPHQVVSPFFNTQGMYWTSTAFAGADGKTTALALIIDLENHKLILRRMDKRVGAPLLK